MEDVCGITFLLEDDSEEITFLEADDLETDGELFLPRLTFILSP